MADDQKFPSIPGNDLTRQASNPVLTTQPTRAAEADGFEEAALVARAQTGQNDAFAQLVTAYQDRVMNLLQRLVPSRDDAEDLAQEAFCKAYEKLHTFNRQSRFYTWLFRIATNLALSHRRRGRIVRFQSLTAPDDDAREAIAQDQRAEVARRREPSPPAAAMQAETMQRITQAIDELDDEFRLPVVLRDVEGLDYNEIAEVLELPAGTIKSRIHRGRVLLRDKLRDLVSNEP
jgi:RNA polymerase sigma-70 factor, ECF subfamily